MKVAWRITKGIFYIILISHEVVQAKEHLAPRAKHLAQTDVEIRPAKGVSWSTLGVQPGIVKASECSCIDAQFPQSLRLPSLTPE